MNFLTCVMNQEECSPRHTQTTLVVTAAAMVLAAVALKRAAPKNESSPSPKPEINNQQNQRLIKNRISAYRQLPAYETSNRDKWFREKKEHGYTKDTAPKVPTMFDANQVKFNGGFIIDNLRNNKKNDIEDSFIKKIDGSEEDEKTAYQYINNIYEVGESLSIKIDDNLETKKYEDLTEEEKELILFILIQKCHFSDMGDSNTLKPSSIIDFCEKALYMPTSDHLFYADQLIGKKCESIVDFFINGMGVYLPKADRDKYCYK